VFKSSASKEKTEKTLAHDGKKLSLQSGIPCALKGGHGGNLGENREEGGRDQKEKNLPE